MSIVTKKSGVEVHRTHEPSLREITIELDGLRLLLDERDRRYDERNTSNKEAVKTAFEASKEAVMTAKTSQDAYNLQHNDLLRKNERMANDMVTRADNINNYKILDDKINDLRSRLITLESVSQGGKSVKDESRTNIALAISLAVFLLGVWVFISQKVQQQPAVYVTNPNALQPTTPVAPLPR